MEMLNKDYIKETTGYEVFTTFYEDFSIAEMFGENAIKDTYERVMKEWKNDYKYLTELVLILNWKCWHKYDKGQNKLSQLYGDLFYKARDYAYENLKGDELEYFFTTTD